MVFIVIVILNPDTSEGQKEFVVINGGLIVLAAVIFVIMEIYSSYGIKDYNDKQDQLIECSKKQSESYEKFQKAYKDYNATVLFLEQRHSDEYDKLKKDLNSNKDEDLETRKRVDKNEQEIDKNRARIEALELRIK